MHHNGGVEFLCHTPAPPLSDFVEMFWLYEGAPRPHAKERILPDGSMELIVNLREDQVRVYGRDDIGRCETRRGAVIVGPYSEFFVIDTAEQMSVAGIHFKPGGAFPFFKLPAEELRDAHVSLDALWGSAANDLREQLLAAPAPSDKFRVLERGLLAQAAWALERHPAVAFALREFSGARSVAAVSGQIGLSARRFIRVFSQEVGLTPKLYCRVRRFQKVLRRIGMGREIDWAGLALDCGYFDQAHFIHDFRAFSGINPTVYVAQRTEHRNHVPLIA
ncbi:MAG: DUF6597 domain-containing transcriptional factor [Bryobacteraceae bacterium]